MSGLRGAASIAAWCRREGIAEGLYYSWSKEFLEAGKKRPADDSGRQATSGEVTGLRQEMRGMNSVKGDRGQEYLQAKSPNLTSCCPNSDETATSD